MFHALTKLETVSLDRSAFSLGAWTFLRREAKSEEFVRVAAYIYIYPCMA